MDAFNSLIGNYQFIILTLLGAGVGSFLNVVIDRLPKGQGLGGRSKADCCRRTLSPSDLIPVLSFVFSRGRCLHCRAKISSYYPIVEFISAGATVLTFFYFPLPYSIFYMANIYFLLVYFFMDLKYGLVSTGVVISHLIFLALSYFLLLNFHLTTYYLLLTTSAAAGLAALFFILLIILTRGRGMGQGDVFLIFVSALGLLDWKLVILMTFMSFMFGGGVSVLLLALGRKKFGQTLPFGPFIVSAAFVSIYWGRNLLDLYLRWLLKYP